MVFGTKRVVSPPSRRIYQCGSLVYFIFDVSAIYQLVIRSLKHSMLIGSLTVVLVGQHQCSCWSCGCSSPVTQQFDALWYWSFTELLLTIRQSILRWRIYIVGYLELKLWQMEQDGVDEGMADGSQQYWCGSGLLTIQMRCCWMQYFAMDVGAIYQVEIWSGKIDRIFHSWVGKLLVASWGYCWNVGCNSTIQQSMVWNFLTIIPTISQRSAVRLALYWSRFLSYLR